MKSQFEATTRPGSNHTGLLLHADQLAEMVDSTDEFGPTTDGGPDAIAKVRIAYAKNADPVATMPPMPMVEAARIPLLDKLGARLQFERTGTRLYDALISKLDAYGSFDGGPSRQDLLLIRNQEHQHMRICQELILAIGGDPTAVTPCANLEGVMAKGVCDVILDPRTTLVECLQAIVVAELADLESWMMLAKAIEAVKSDAAVTISRITEAEQHELEHLAKVRSWLTAADAARIKQAGGNGKPKT